MKNNETFNWVSQSLFDYSDKVQLVKSGVYLETGLSENDSNILSYTPTRVSFKMKDMKLNAKLEFEFNFSDIFLFATKIQEFIKNNVSVIDFKCYKKNKVRSFNIYHTANPKMFKVVISDNSSTIQSIITYFDETTIYSLVAILIQLKSNWILAGSNLQNIATNQKVIGEISNINNNINKLINIQLQTNNLLNNLNINIPPTTTTSIEPYDYVSTSNIVSNHTEEILQEEQIDTEVDDVPFDVDSITVKDYTNIKYETPGSSIFTIDDDALSNIELESNLDDGFDTVSEDSIESDIQYEDSLENIDGFGDIIEKSSTELTSKKINKKQVNLPRPFFNNFLNWDLNTLNVWITGFAAADSNSSALTTMPTELLFFKSQIVDYINDLKKDPNYISHQLYILTNLKSSIKSYSDTLKFPKFKNYRFLNVEKINKNNNKPLWDFIIDIIVLGSIYRYFTHNLKSFKNLDSTDAYKDIKIAQYFINMFIYSYTDILDENCKKDVFDDCIEVISNLLTKDTLNCIQNCYTSLTKGGTMKLDLSNINTFLDKYIEHLFNYDDFSDEEMPNIQTKSEIQEYLNTKYPKPIKQQDERLVLFIKYIKHEKLDFEIDPKCINFNDIDISKTTDTKIIDGYKCIKNNPEITRVKQILQEIEKNNKVIINVKESTPKEKEHKTSVWDLSDSVADDIFNAFLS